MKSLSGFFILLLSLNVFSQSEVNLGRNSHIFVVCQRQKEIRWLRAFKLDNGHCKTYYSKEGYVQVVSSASYFSSCEAVLGAVKKNIEEGGFRCAEKELSAMIEIE